MARILAALLSGVLFGLGLAISGMTDPAVVLGFLDLFGDFNPALMFVLGGAVGTTMLAFRLVLRRPAPLLEDKFQLPTRKDIDARLVIGAGLFGIGWGLAGYCPGPALVSAGALVDTALVFVPVMLVSGVLTRRLLAGR
ncbi:MAG: DUF6691 family protein [Stenotrophomonas koreensis]|jgi:Predicted transporter component|uniref:Transporter n=1 Tax=Stenotrophomonas koreensis TaxID=266128 RepID=A0A0R0BY59_9GAMM|nr:DUF6691 family protein [Stenotrophomonas koreensis]KRG58292.1 hypothetical protein ABB25_06440 [Stenotrophomonas koreensis]